MQLGACNLPVKKYAYVGCTLGLSGACSRFYLDVAYGERSLAAVRLYEHGGPFSQWVRAAVEGETHAA